VLIRVAQGELNRVMIFAPPRHGKSELLSRLFSAYYLNLFPERWVGINSYAAELAFTLSRNSRDNYLSSGSEMRESARAVKHWETDQSGGLWSAGVGGPITGKGFHLGIIDDPIKNAKEALSEAVQRDHQDWYPSTFYTREEPNGAIVLQATRWNQSDLPGWLLAQEAGEEPEHWHIVCLEAIKEEKSIEIPPTCTLEPDDRAVGEALCPERYPIEKLRKIQQRIGPYYWNALYRQRPAPREGGLFKLADLAHEVSVVPVGANRVRYWDLGGSDSTKADYSVGCLMAEHGGLFYVEDIQRGQWSPRDRNQKMKDTAQSDLNKYGVIPTWIEKVPGLAVEVIANIIRDMAGFSVHTEMAKNDKETRADPFASQCEGQNVRVLKADWNIAFRNELTAFPHGDNDDQVDAASGAFSKLANARELEMF
jgi:predicted phage terminase large subunit-like protein